VKRAVNLRLEESTIVTLNNLSQELHTSKTDIVEKAIRLFSKESKTKQNNLLQFAGKLTSSECNKMLEAIENDKNSKNFELEL